MAGYGAIGRSLIVRLADNHYALGKRYAEWCASAPLVGSTADVATMAHHALGHARALYGLLYNESDENTEPEAREAFAPVTLLARPFRTLLEVLAANFLFDRALLVVVAAALESSWTPFATLAHTMIADKRPHAIWTDGWVRQLGSEGGPTARGLESAILHDWDETFCWLGPQDDPQADALYAAAILNAMPDVLRARLLASIGPTAVASGLRLPLQPAPRGNAWELILPLPWDRWDARHWRLTPAEHEGLYD